MPPGHKRPETGPLPCALCHQIKPRKEFRMVKHKDRKPYRHSYCNDCRRIAVRESVAKHRAKRRQQNEGV